MGECKKEVTPLLTHWSYVFLALTHRYDNWLPIESARTSEQLFEPIITHFTEAQIYASPALIELTHLP